jgi:hypothetical protein
MCLHTLVGTSFQQQQSRCVPSQHRNLVQTNPLLVLAIAATRLSTVDSRADKFGPGNASALELVSGTVFLLPSKICSHRRLSQARRTEGPPFQRHNTQTGQLLSPTRVSAWKSEFVCDLLMQNLSRLLRVVERE